MNPESESSKELDLPKPKVNVQPFTDQEIRGLLATLPQAKYKAGVEVADAQKKVDQAKQTLDVELAKRHLEARSMDDLTSDGDRKAYAKNHSDVQKADTALITARGDLKIAELKWERLDDFFIGVRKAASLLEDQYKAMKDYELHRNPN